MLRKMGRVRRHREHFLSSNFEKLIKINGVMFDKSVLSKNQNIYSAMHKILLAGAGWSLDNAPQSDR